VPDLASRVLGLSLRRLSADIQVVHGHPAFLAETFVDVSRFTGACYRASNWRPLGLTRGFARGRAATHGRRRPRPAASRSGRPGRAVRRDTVRAGRPGAAGGT